MGACKFSNGQCIFGWDFSELTGRRFNFHPHETCLFPWPVNTVSLPDKIDKRLISVFLRTKDEENITFHEHKENKPGRTSSLSIFRTNGFANLLCDDADWATLTWAFWDNVGQWTVSTPWYPRDIKYTCEGVVISYVQSGTGKGSSRRCIYLGSQGYQGQLSGFQVWPWSKPTLHISATEKNSWGKYFSVMSVMMKISHDNALGPVICVRTHVKRGHWSNTFSSSVAKRLQSFLAGRKYRRQTAWSKILPEHCHRLQWPHHRTETSATGSSIRYARQRVATINHTTCSLSIALGRVGLHISHFCRIHINHLDTAMDAILNSCLDFSVMSHEGNKVKLLCKAGKLRQRAAPCEKLRFTFTLTTNREGKNSPRCSTSQSGAQLLSSHTLAWNISSPAKRAHLCLILWQKSLSHTLPYMQ